MVNDLAQLTARLAFPPPFLLRTAGTRCGGLGDCCRPSGAFSALGRLLCSGL